MHIVSEQQNFEEGMDNLVISVIGHRNSGKSTTWYELFERTVSTGTELKKLYLTTTEYVEVFLVSGSPEERQTYVGDIIGSQRPELFCARCSINKTLQRPLTSL